MEKDAEKAITPRQLHDWYLEATRGLNPDSFNPNAQKSYDALTDGQRIIIFKLTEQHIHDTISHDKNLRHNRSKPEARYGSNFRQHHSQNQGRVPCDDERSKRQDISGDS